MVLKRDIVSIDAEAQSSRFYGRFAANALVIALADAAVLVVGLLLGDLMLWHINQVPISLTNGILIVPAWTVASLVARLLPGWGLGPVDELRRVQSTLFVLFALVLLISFFTKITLTSSRIVFIVSYVFSGFGIPLARTLVRSIVIHLGCWGVPVAIYGEVDSLKTIVRALRDQMSLGYIPSVAFSDDAKQGQVVEGVPVMGHIRNTTFRVPIAIFSMSDAPRHHLVETLEGPLEVYRRVILIPDLKEAPSLWVRPRDLQGILGLEITKNLLNPVARFIKRFIDLFLVLITMPLWFPLISFIYALIWLEDRKNPIFLQDRVGRGGGTFRTVKFRTMVPDAEKVLQKAMKKNPALKAEWEKYFKLKKDPRITRVGRFLRVTSLDELPQLLNVLRGSMSLVGPRPLPAYHFQDLPEHVRFLRDKVQPGITGLWQVSGRSESGTEGMERWDPYYVRNWSIWLDIMILARTFRAVLFARGAY